MKLKGITSICKCNSWYFEALYTITVRYFKLKKHELASSVGQDKTVEHQNASVKLWQSDRFFVLNLNSAVQGDIHEVPVVVFTLERESPCDSHVLWSLSWGRGSHLWALCLDRTWIHIACAQVSISVTKGHLLPTDMREKRIMESVVVENPCHCQDQWSLLILLFNQNCKLQKIYC